MKLTFIFIFILSFSLAFASPAPIPATFSNVRNLEFQQNVGQLKYEDGTKAEDILYFASVPGGEVYVRRTGLSFVMIKGVPPDKQKSIDDKFGTDKTLSNKIIPKSEGFEVCRTEMNFEDANESPVIRAEEMTEAFTNYYVGREEYYGVRSFRKIVLENVYENIDFVLYQGDSNRIEYDFVVNPGGNPKDIALSFVNHNGLNISENKSLIIKSNLGTIEHYNPVTYQENSPKLIQSNYKIENDIIRFEVGNYNSNQKLIIDPVVRMWVMAYGGDWQDEPQDMDADNKGYLYITGHSFSSNLKVNVFQTQYMKGNMYNGFLLKYDYNGKMVWGTYLGGNDDDEMYAVKIDHEGNIIVGGFSASPDFPADSFQKVLPKFKYLHNVIIKFTPDCKKMWGTFCSTKEGSSLNDLDVDKNNDIVFTGIINLSKYYNSFDTSRSEKDDIFVTKLSSDCHLIWSRVYHGKQEENDPKLAVDSSNNIIIIGKTYSTSISGSKQKRTDTVLSDIFYSKLDPHGNILWTNIYGGNHEEGPKSIQINKKNKQIICGYTLSNDLKMNGFIKNYNWVGDGFIIECDSNGILNWSTYVNTKIKAFDEVTGCSIDRFDNMYFICNLYDTLNVEINPIEGHYYQSSLKSTDMTLLKVNKNKDIEFYTFYGSGWAGEWGKMVIADSKDNIFMGGEVLTEDYKYDLGEIGSSDNHHLSLIKYTYPITIPELIKTLCLGADNKVEFLVNKKRLNPEKFVVELSDTNGKFENKIRIGELLSDTSGIIKFFLPDTLLPGNKYRLIVRNEDSTLVHEYPEEITLATIPQPQILTEIDSVCNQEEIRIENKWNKDSGYDWEIDGGNIITKDTVSVTYKWSEIGKQRIILTETNKLTGCFNSVEKEIFVKPVTPLQIDSLNTLCENDNPIILDNGKPKGGYYSCKGVNDGMFYPDSAGAGTHSISYSYINEYNCTSTISCKIKVNPKPQKPEIISYFNQLESTKGTEYRWYRNDELIDSLKKVRTIAYPKSGIYRVSIKNELGCWSDLSEPFDFVNGIEDDIIEGITLSPNPVEDYIEINVGENGWSSEEIRIYDVFGRCVVKNNPLTPFDKGELKIDVSGLAAGIYFVRIGAEVQKFIKL